MNVRGDPGCAAAGSAYTRCWVRRCAPTGSATEGAAAMNVRLGNADLILILALALGAALLLALRFRPKTWRGLLLEALLANVAAIAAVLTFEALLA
ncbi:hypothetical protein BDAG_02230 [Burkholderia dolosa AU0158]|nr:hypothetical protein BDAG_02230 [Burkholderia dolosa AU0158]